MPVVKTISYRTIKPFLRTGNFLSRFFSYAGLGAGVLLLLCCLQMYINIDQLLRDKSPRKNGFDFISVTREITNADMGKDNRFSPAEVSEIRKQPFVTDAAPLLSNQFRVKASAGNILPFSTDLFLEAIRNDFIDTVPPNFNWQPGQTEVPIIFSSDYLEMYNVFAPAQDLPQISAETAGAVTIFLDCYTPSGTTVQFRSRIVAVSDRISSIIVPLSFLDWANKNFGTGTGGENASRVYLKTRDANAPELQQYLDQKNYRVNKDRTKFGRIKGTLQAIVSGLGGLGILVVLLSVLLFSFYLQLMVSRSKDNLQLLLTLGYSPGWLSRTVTNKWMPIYAVIILLALAATQFFQWLFKSKFALGGDMLSPYIHWIVIAVAAVFFLMCLLFNYRSLRTMLFRLGQ